MWRHTRHWDDRYVSVIIDLIPSVTTACGPADRQGRGQFQTSLQAVAGRTPSRVQFPASATSPTEHSGCFARRSCLWRGQ
jgi:hypothetical protein